MKKIIQFFLLLIFFTFQINASANSIPVENIDSLPDLSALENADLVYDYTVEKFIWINHNSTKADLTKSELSLLSENNPFAHLSSNPSEVLRSIFPSKANDPASNALVSLTNPLSVVISYLNTSQISPIIQTASIPAPSSLWLVIIGLFGLISQKSKSSSNYIPKPSKQFESMNHPKNTLFNIPSLQKTISVPLF